MNRLVRSRCYFQGSIGGILHGKQTGGERYVVRLLYGNVIIIYLNEIHNGVRACVFMENEIVVKIDHIKMCLPCGWRVKRFLRVRFTSVCLLLHKVDCLLCQILHVS